MTTPPSRRDLLSGVAGGLIAGAALRSDEAKAANQAPDADAALLPPVGPGAVPRSIENKLLEKVSILDFIPTAEHSRIRDRSSTADCAPFFQSAIDHVREMGGGELFVPAGRYRCGSPVTLTRFLHLRGAGKASAHIQFTHAGRDVPSGSGLRLIQPSNSATEAYVKVSDLFAEMVHPENRGACFYDNCSNYLTLRDCTFARGRFGVVFDQTEVSGLYSCNLAGQLAGGAGLWIVNGPDIRPGNSGGFTNQISVDHNCQFNQGEAYAVVDDGGEAHFFGNNNYNGGGLKFAGVGNLTLLGGEFESVNGRPTLTFGYRTHYSKSGVGACHAIIMNPLINQPPGQPCIRIDSMYTMTLIRASLIATATSACVQGMSNLGSLFARFNSNPNASVPLFDSYAGGGHDDGNLPIHQVVAAAYTLGSREWNALLQTQSDQPVSVKVPSHSALPYAIGTRIMIEQAGTGPVTLQPDDNVILDGTLGTTRPNQLLTLIKTSSHRWLVIRQD